MRFSLSMPEKNFLIVLLVGLVLVTQGQNIQGIPASTPLTNCVARQWAGENGFVTHNLTSVLQASSGFLWVPPQLQAPL